MRVTSTLLPLVIISLASCPLHAQFPSEWKQVIDKNNVEVFIHQCHEMNVRAFKAVTTVSMSLDSLEAIFDKIEDYPNWQSSVKESKIVHRSSDDRYHYYSRTQQGWPAKDRDLIWAVQKSWDEHTSALIYDQVCSTNTLPEKRGEGGLAAQAFVTWRLEPTAENEVKVTYNLTVQQGGRVPNWLIAMLSPDGPYKTLAGLKEQEIKGDGNSSAAMD